MGCTCTSEMKSNKQKRAFDIQIPLSDSDNTRIKMVLDYWYGYSGNGNMHDLQHILQQQRQMQTKINNSIQRVNVDSIISPAEASINDQKQINDENIEIEERKEIKTITVNDPDQQKDKKISTLLSPNPSSSTGTGGGSGADQTQIIMRLSGPHCKNQQMLQLQPEATAGNTIEEEVEMPKSSLQSLVLVPELNTYQSPMGAINQQTNNNDKSKEGAQNNEIIKQEIIEKVIEQELYFCQDINILQGWDRNSKMPPEMFKRWFGGDKLSDEEISEMFEKDLEDIGMGLVKRWEQHAQGQLATIILCDQISRSIYRGLAQAFSFDHISLRLTKKIISQIDHFKSFKLFEKLFILMPLLHSENIEDCELGVEVLSKIIRHLKDENSEDSLIRLFELNKRWGENHLEILTEYGRFPHRNKVLGRESTEDEEIYLKDAAIFGAKQQ